MVNFAKGVNIGTVSSTQNTVSSAITGKVIGNTIQLALTLFAQDAQNAICPCGNGSCGTPTSVQCTDVNCIEDYFHKICPDAFLTPPYQGNCSLKGSLSTGHTTFTQSAQYHFSNSIPSHISGVFPLPNSRREFVRVLMHQKSPLCSPLVSWISGKHPVPKISGACETQASRACGIPTVIDGIIGEFQKAFPMRYIIGIGDCTVAPCCSSQ